MSKLLIAKIRATLKPGTFYAGSEEWFTYGPFETREEAEQYACANADSDITHTGRVMDGFEVGLPYDADDILEAIYENLEGPEDTEIEASPDAMRLLNEFLRSWIENFVTADKSAIEDIQPVGQRETR